jgi:hypothetical protein
MRLDAGVLAGTIGQHFDCLEPAACCLAPPDPIIGLLEPALLAKIQDGQQEQTSRSYG